MKKLKLAQIKINLIFLLSILVNKMSLLKVSFPLELLSIYLVNFLEKEIII